MLEKLPPISQDFINETYYRTEWAINSINLFEIYRNKRTRDRDLYREFRSITEITLKFSMLSIYTLFDGSGNLSLTLHHSNQGIYSIQKTSLKRLFPNLEIKKFNSLFESLNRLLSKNSTLVDRIKHTRDEYLAHAGRSSYHLGDPIRLTTIRFPAKKYLKFIYSLEFHFLGIAFGYAPHEMPGELKSRL